MAHQYNILRDPADEIGIFGGYGSGKTFTGMLSDEKHIIVTPNGETLIGADTLIQLDNTIKKDLEKDVPLELVQKYNRQKNSIQFTNGHVLYYRPLAEEGDIRSYNLTRAHLLESSEIKYESFTQLTTRMRNSAAIVYEYDKNGNPIMEPDPDTGGLRPKEDYRWIQLINESNPDSGWIREDFVMRSPEITIYFDDKQHYHIDPRTVQPGRSTHIIPSKANYMLPKNFIRNLAKDKPDWWIKRYLHGSFLYSEGMVYPNAPRQIIQDMHIPNNMPRMIGMDYGLNDNTHFVFLALDFEGILNNGRPAIYAYDELVMNNMSISQIANTYRHYIRHHLPKGILYKTPVMDGRSFAKRTVTGDKMTMGSLFAQEGVIFKPAQMDLAARVLKTNDFIDQFQLYFFENSVPKLITEIKKYKYPERKLETSTKTHQKPVDKDNHGINALEFALMEIPKNLKPMVGEIVSRQSILRKKTDSEWDPLDRNQQPEYEGFASLFREV